MLYNMFLGIVFQDKDMRFNLVMKLPSTEKFFLQIKKTCCITCLHMTKVIV